MVQNRDQKLPHVFAKHCYKVVVAAADKNSDFQKTLVKRESLRLAVYFSVRLLLRDHPRDFYEKTMS